MISDRILGLTFVLYCTTVGVVFLLIPWSPGWDQMLAHLPWQGLRLFEKPLLRGALSGFGLVHLVWGAHDLHRFLCPPLHDDGKEHS